MLKITVALTAWVFLAMDIYPQDFLVCDFDKAEVKWRSKFSRHDVVEVKRNGKERRALRFRFDLSRPPHYDWFRAIVEKGIDVRRYNYLSFWVKANGTSARMMPMLMQFTKKSSKYPYGEIVASAWHHPVILSFTGWRQLSVPLSAFNGLGQIADHVQMINFSLSQKIGNPRAAELLIDEIMFATKPHGEILKEEIPFPPADIAIANEVEFFNLLDLDRPELRDVRTAVQAHNWIEAKKAWAKHLETRERPRWTWSRRDKDRIMALFDEKFGGLKRYIGAADRILARDFNFLGVRKKLKRDIDWLQGPVEWTHVLSRFSYWKGLGYAYWGTNNSDYAEDFVYMLKDWIADNPVPRILTNSRGPHGTVWRTLEAGIRGDVWFDVMELFMNAPEFDSEAKYLMTKSLVEHARHLYRYEVAFRFGNWQVVECAGLAAIGIMLPEFKEAASWRERAFSYLTQHMQNDVYPDGAHHELTPGYHSWVMERFLKASLLCKLNGYDVPKLMERHEKMFEFLMRISKPDGRYPPIGDAGGGSSIRANMGLGALLYNRADMRYLAINNIAPSWIWLFGPDVVEQYKRLTKRPPDFTSTMLPHAQYCVMRTGWERNDKYLLFDCAPWGGGHSHQDRLQVVVYAGGRDLLIDPGIYSYDQPLSRTYFRLSKAHNILIIDGQRQMQSDPKLLAWAVANDADFAVGEIVGDNGLRHRRSVLFVKHDYWIVVDHVFGEGEHELTRLFHFPLVQVASDDKSARTMFKEGTNILVKTVGDAKLEMRKGWIPVGGARAKEASVAAFVNRCKLPAVTSTILFPFDNADELPEATSMHIDDSLAIRLNLTFKDGQHDDIVIAPDITEIETSGGFVHARAICVRSGPRSSAFCIIDHSGVHGELKRGDARPE